jgi:hypothetical protein
MTDESAHHISAEGLAALEAELHALETEGRRAIAERIKTAREWGDLKENAEYHEAKDAQAHLETKILRLRGPAPPRRLRGAGRGGRCAFGAVLVTRRRPDLPDSYKRGAPCRPRVSDGSALRRQCSREFASRSAVIA